MAVDDRTVLRVAGLARLKLEPGEVSHLTQELNSILGWIDRLQAVKTADIAPLSSVIPLTREWRADEITDGDIQADILRNAPEAAHGFFAVPKVIE